MQITSPLKFISRKSEFKSITVCFTHETEEGRSSALAKVTAGTPRQLTKLKLQKQSLRHGNVDLSLDTVTRTAYVWTIRNI